MLLAFLAGVICLFFGVWGMIDDVLYSQPVRSWLYTVVVLGVILTVLATVSWYTGKAQQKAEAEAEAKRAKEAEEAEAERQRQAKEAEAQRKAEAEARNQERMERVRRQIEAEAAELEALENEDNIERVYRLTHCVSPSAQENIFYCYEGSRVYFSGDDEHDDVVWVVNDSGDRLGRLPKDAAAQYLEKGALGAFIKSLEDEDQNTIPFVRVFWRRT